MGKLVLFLADGTTRDILLDRERITIGRRADNDVCLPFPAVSGEHAQVVTILADSFLEDLGSTNGTLVNGKAVTKHFLTDNDQIDIGRQRLTYLSNDDAKPSHLQGESARAQLQGLLDRVPSAKPAEVLLPAARAPQPAVHAHARDTSPARAAMPSATPRPAPPVREPDAPGYGAPRRDAGSETSPLALKANGGAAEAAAPPPTPTVPTVRVLSGVSTGVRVPFAKSELTIGRVGVQVAVIRRSEGGYVLVPLEGREPPRINGAPVAPEGTALHPGDTFEVAGVRLELSADA
ncbi:MAG: FHA domain-containing protein [Burkholderiales bacterium]